MLKIENVKVYEDLDFEGLKNFVIKKYKIDKKDLLDFQICKKSIDARDKSNVHYNYSFVLNIKQEKVKKYSKYLINENINSEKLILGRKSKYRPVIVGFGPSRYVCCFKIN